MAQTVCPHCSGTGRVLSYSVLSLSALRHLRNYLASEQPSGTVTLKTTVPILTYLVNHKKQALTELEKAFSCTIHVEIDTSLVQEGYKIAGYAPVSNQKKVVPSKNRLFLLKQKSLSRKNGTVTKQKKPDNGFRTCCSYFSTYCSY